MFSFGSNFIHWIRTLYTQISSCVTNNGHASSFFPVTRGIRQGCPISAMLFIIVVELLSTHIKNSPNVRGIDINNDTFVITQLADDTTLFLNDRNSVRNALSILDRFYESTGLRLNKQKCEIFMLGNCGQANNPPGHLEGLKCITGSFKALGIHFCKDITKSVEMNCADKLKSIRTVINMWLQRNLTLKGKIVVLKSLILPKLLFTCSNTYVPDIFVNQVQELTFQFLWGNKPAKIKKETIIADIQKGGLKMPLFSANIESARIMWVRRIIAAKDSKWARLALTLMNTTEFGLYCKDEPSAAGNALTPFYVEILGAWYKYHSKEPQLADEMKQE